MRRSQRFSVIRQCLRAGRIARSGSAAIEFAFVAPIFFTLMLAILQLGIMIFGQFALQNAVTEAARLIRTGQAQNMNIGSATQCMGGTTPGNYATAQAWFNGQVCCGITPLLNCGNPNFSVTVTTMASGFATNGFGALGAANTYNPGNACDVVLVRATYPFPIWVPGLAGLLGGGWSLADTMGGNFHTISGTSAFRNEPFNSGVTGC